MIALEGHEAMTDDEVLEGYRAMGFDDETAGAFLAVLRGRTPAHLPVD